MAGFLQLVADPRWIGHRDRVLRDRTAHADNIRFLKTILPYAGIALKAERGNLTGQVEHRHGIVIGAADPGNHVGAAWAAGADGNTEVARDPRVGIGRHGAGLFVQWANKIDIRMFGHGVNQVQRRPARDGEDVTHALAGYEIGDEIREFHARSGPRHGSGTVTRAAIRSDRIVSLLTISRWLG